MEIEMRNIWKTFGKNEVLKDVSISIKGGEICALLGENGAGKSTLMNILGGVIKKDSGSIILDGKEVDFENPGESIDSGIAFIHQELNLVNDLPIYENMFLGREIKTKRGSLDLKEMYHQTKDMFEKMNVDLDPRKMVGDLDASYKQIVEICRAMMMEASIIIMDEPTTSLTDSEIKRVFKMMRTMKAHDVGIIFISHKLNEVMQVCDKFLVLRDGKLVAEGDVQDVTTKELANLMVGFDVRTDLLRRNKHPDDIGEEVLRVEGLTDEEHFRDIHFTVRAGEIIGFTGLLGDGRSELFQAVFGARPFVDGKVFLYGKEMQFTRTFQAIEAGIAYLPRNRKENAILKDMNVLENASIVTWPLFSRTGLIDFKKHRRIFEQQRDTLRLKMGALTDSITSLSGGNQQKVVLSKWLAAKPKVLILDNPTQGVDVGAKEDIYDIIIQLAEEEKIAVIVLSSEAQEVIRVCDKVYVMYHGLIQGVVRDEDMNEHTIMRLATGGSTSMDRREYQL